MFESNVYFIEKATCCFFSTNRDEVHLLCDIVDMLNFKDNWFGLNTASFDREWTNQSLPMECGDVIPENLKPRFSTIRGVL